MEAINKYYYNLDNLNREFFKGMELERNQLNNTGEDYIIKRLNEFDLNYTNITSNFKNDDGVDFIVKFKGVYFISQIKYWLKKPLNYKEIKQYFGEMKLSKVARELQNENVRYLLVCPFINERNKNRIIEMDNDVDELNILYENKFIEFLINPIYTLEMMTKNS